MASEELRPSRQQLLSNSKLSITTWVNLEADPSPIKPLSKTAALAENLIVSLWETLRQRTRKEAQRSPMHRNCEINIILLNHKDLG